MTALKDIPASREVPMLTGIFGDGGDGAATLDGTNTVAWASKSGSVYTMTRDCALTSLTINSGSTLKPNGWRIFVQGTLSNAGIIDYNGNDGTGAGVAGTGITSGILPQAAGGAGNTGAGSSGAAGNVNGEGGPGGTGSAGAAGPKGNATIGTSAIARAVFNTPFSALAGIFVLTNSGRLISGGTGGGGAGGDGTNKGGGGGSAGGAIIIFARTFTNTGTVQANGGAGGSPSTGNTGGGGGGGGGLVLIYTVNTPTLGTITVTAGGGGTKQGTGTNGSGGTAGYSISVVLA
jgi:hypothetical protein